MTSIEYLLLPTQTQLVFRLKQLIGFSSSFIFLSGSQGSGRTSVVQLLMNELETSCDVSYVSLTPEMELSGVREHIELQLVPGAGVDPDEPLDEALIRLIPDLSVPRLLVIDNADCQSPEWLLELWQWLAYVDELYPLHKISVLLIAGSEFSGHLAQHLKGRDQKALEIKVEPLTLREQKILLVNCLQDGDVSAAQGKVALARLAHSQGTPGEVVAIAEAVMDKKSLSSFGINDLPVNKVVAAVAVLAGIVLLLSWMIPSQSEKEPVNQPERQAVALAPATSAADGVVPVSGALPAAVVQDGIVSGAVTTGIDAEQPADDGDKRRVVISDQVVNQMTANQPITGVVAEENPAQAPQASSAVTSLDQLQPVVNDIKTKSSSAVQNEPANTQVAPAKKTVQPKPKTTAERKKVKATATVAKKTTQPKRKTTVAPAGSYALQLAASGNPAALRQLAASNGVQAKTQIYKNQSNGMYVLVYGQYSSATAAKAAVTGLPAALQSSKPWPKSYAQINKEQSK